MVSMRQAGQTLHESFARLGIEGTFPARFLEMTGAIHKSALVYDGNNWVFRLNCDNGRFALKVYGRVPAHILDESERRWAETIESDTALLIAAATIFEVPMAQFIEDPESGDATFKIGDHLAELQEWLDGSRVTRPNGAPFIRKVNSPIVALSLSKSIAQLHVMASQMFRISSVPFTPQRSGEGCYDWAVLRFEDPSRQLPFRKLIDFDIRTPVFKEIVRDLVVNMTTDGWARSLRHPAKSTILDQNLVAKFIDWESNEPTHLPTQAVSYAQHCIEPKIELLAVYFAEYRDQGHDLKPVIDALERFDTAGLLTNASYIAYGPTDLSQGLGHDLSIRQLNDYLGRLTEGERFITPFARAAAIAIMNIEPDLAPQILETGRFTINAIGCGGTGIAD